MAIEKPMSEKKTATILIVDDHPAVREGLALRISGQHDLEVCGQAADVGEALQLISSRNPDAAIIDISLKSGNGIDLIKRIKARNDTVRMLVWSMHNETLYAERALRAGAMGYINKEHATDQIIAAIRSVLAGKIYLSESMSAQLLGRILHSGVETVSRSPVETLSDRELEVFNLFGHGHDTIHIAEQMCISPKTVETYRSRIKEKLNLTTSVELLRYAMQWIIEKEG